MTNISRGRLPSLSLRGCRYSYGYCGQFSLGRLFYHHSQNWNNRQYLLLPVCLRDFSAIERKGNIICCLRSMLKLSCENQSAAAMIHACSNDSLCTQAHFPAKKSSCFEDQKLHVIAALFINYFHQFAFIYFLEKFRSQLLGETELCS